MAKCRTFLLVSTLLLLGCAHGAADRPSPFAPARDGVRSAMSADVRVEVRNEHLLPMRVWAEWPGLRRFLGDVAPGSATIFLVPRDLVERLGPLRLHADPTGSVDEALSDPIDVAWGTRVEWRLRRVLANSRVRVM
jgi:hypothetical protein